MPVPARLLDDAEEVVVDVRPHAALAPAVALAVAAVVAAGAGVYWSVARAVAWVLVAVLAIAQLYLLARYLRWRATCLVVTTRRVVRRRGIIVRTIREVPLAQVTDVSYRQSLFERLIRAGDVHIQSAGLDRADVFAALPRPAAIQREITRLITERSEQPERLDEARLLGPRVRVVSLVPSVTETLLAWGVGPVAVTRFCEQPQLRAVGGTKNPDIDAIVALAPDLVVLDREENRRPDAEALAAAGLRLHVTQVRAVGDVATALADLRVALGLDPGKVAPLPDAPSRERRPRVYVPIWRRPWMSINKETYGSSLLHAAGADNVLADRPDPYPAVPLEEVAALVPDLVLAPSEPYPFAARHAPLFAGVAPYLMVDGKDLFWWGVRAPAALARLRALIEGAFP